MAIKVTFSVGETEKRIYSLYQWDYGQTLEIEAPYLPTIVEVHFACRDMSEAVVRVCSTALNVATVAIPDLCLEHTGDITAWVYGIEGTSGRTLYRVSIPVIARARPSRSEAIPEDVQDQYTQLITEVNEAVEKITEGAVVAAKATHATNADRATHADNASSASSAVLAQSATKDGAGNIIADTYLKKATQFEIVSDLTNFGGKQGRVYAFEMQMDQSFTNMTSSYSWTAVCAIPEGVDCVSALLGLAYKDGKTYVIEMTVSGSAVSVYAESLDGTDTWYVSSEESFVLKYCPLFALPVG